MTPGDARCPNHPELPALGNCQRCGTFFCAGDRLEVDGVAYCRPCGLRPDVDWIEAYRQSLLGKRDGWGWLLGLSAVGYLILCANLASASTSVGVRLLAIPAAGSAISGALFFFGKPISRPLLIASTALWSVALLALYGPWTLPGAVLSGLFVASAWVNTRNRLFFRLDVSRKELKKDYERLADNPLARNAFALGILSLVLPFVGPVAIVCGAIAAHAVNPAARPPIGKLRFAIAGIIFGVLGTLIGVLWITFGLTGRQ